MGWRLVVGCLVVLVGCGGGNEKSEPRAKRPPATISTTSTNTSTSATTTAAPLTEADTTFVEMVRVDPGVLRLVGRLSSSDTYSGTDSEIAHVGEDICDHIGNDPTGLSPEQVIASWEIDDSLDSQTKLGLLSVNFYCDEYGPLVEANKVPSTTTVTTPATQPPGIYPQLAEQIMASKTAEQLSAICEAYFNLTKSETVGAATDALNNFPPSVDPGQLAEAVYAELGKVC